MKIKTKNLVDNKLWGFPYLFLIPFKNTQALLAPIDINSYVLNELMNIQTIFSKLSFDNLVKNWITNQLLMDKVEVNGILKNRKLLKIIEPISSHLISFIDFDIPKLFEFKEDLTLRLAANKYNDTVAGCYIIMFKKSYYYYIGSSTNLKLRLNLSRSTRSYLDGSKFIKVNFNQYMIRLISNGFLDLHYEVNILYLTKNYLNLFIYAYPDYKLSKGEYIFLKKITDFYVKVLETSLIKTYLPLLNSADAGYFKHVNWNDNYLNTYNINYKDYDRHNKYHVYVETPKDGFKQFYRSLIINMQYRQSLINSCNKTYWETINAEPIMSEKDIKYYREGFIRSGTLNDICKRYNLKQDEVLNNLNKYHHYEGAGLRNPIKIIEE